MKYSRYVALLAVALLFGACDMLLGTDDRWGFLEFEASVEFSPDSTSLLPVLHITNHSTGEVELVADVCSEGTALAVYDGDGQRVWDKHRSYEQADEPPVCRTHRVFVTILPGRQATTSRGFTAWIKTMHILGDSLPEGAYQLSVRPHFVGGPKGPEFPVGEVNLRR